MLLVTGTVLWFTKYSLKADGNKKNLGIIDALIVGTVQGLAITPGISRSGTTIAAATFRGIDRETAARFSFLLAIPVDPGSNGNDGEGHYYSRKRRNFFSHNRKCCCRNNRLHFSAHILIKIVTHRQTTSFLLLLLACRVVYNPFFPMNDYLTRSRNLAKELSFHSAPFSLL